MGPKDNRMVIRPRHTCGGGGGGDLNDAANALMNIHI